MKGRAQVANQLALAIRSSAIGEQDYGDLGAKIDPKGATGVPQMPDRVRRKVLAGR